MNKFYQDTTKNTFHEITLDIEEFSIKTVYGDFRLYHHPTRCRESVKSYKKLETAQRNFEKRCKEWEAKGYVLSDPYAPVVYRRRVDQVKNGETDQLEVTIRHKKNYEEISQLKNLKRLTISGDFHVPKSLMELENLEYLSLRYGILNVPDNIGNLKNLKTFKIYSCNSIKKLPDSICDCEELTHIGCGKIPTLPANIGKLKKLRILNMTHGSFSTFPPSIEECDGLEIINGQYCRSLNTLPVEFGKLKNLKRISFDRSGFKTFPDCITEIKTLEEIDFGQTGITALPENIGNLTNLKVLKLKCGTKGVSGISKLPESFFNLVNLEELDLSFHSLKEFSKGFQKLTNLKDLKVHGNPFENLPKEIVQKGRKAIFQYFDWLKEDEAFTVETSLSDAEIQDLCLRYDERIARFVKKKTDSYRTAPVEDIRDFLTFKTDDIPFFSHPARRYEHTAMLYFPTMFAPISEWTEIEHRMMLILTQGDWGVPETFRERRAYRDSGWADLFFGWYKGLLKSGNEPTYEEIYGVLKKYGKEEDAFEAILYHGQHHLVVDDKVGKLGEYILQCFKDDPKGLIEKLFKYSSNAAQNVAENVANLLILFTRKEFEPFVEDWFFHKYPNNNGAFYYVFSTYNLRKLCAPNPEKYEDLLLRIHDSNVRDIVKTQLCIYFENYYGDKHKDLILKSLDKTVIEMVLIKHSTYDNYHNPNYGTAMTGFLDWLLTNYKAEFKDIVFEISQENIAKFAPYMPFVTKAYGKDAVPLFEVFLRDKIALKKMFLLLKDYDYSAFHNILWDLLKSTERSERNLAVKELVRLYSAKDLLKEIPTHLKARKAADRLGATELLMGIDDKKALKLLQETFKSEQDSHLRNILIEHFQKVGADKFLKKELLSGFEWAKEKGKLKKPVKKWLDESKLPALYWKNGKKVDVGLPRYLFSRQKDKAQEWYKPTAEVALILENIDRKKSGEFAEKLLAKTLSADGLKATSKAVLGVITELGDDKIIEPLKKYAIDRANVVAPRMLGEIISDQSARALDGIMLHFKTKYPNVRGAAMGGFDNIAEKMGLNRFELMDKMIPDFGFKDLFKEFEVNGETWRAFINADLKLSYLNELDAIKKTLPTKTPKPIKEEVKALNKEIRSIAKNQKTSLEHNLIIQRRWSVADWHVHFMAKPLPFAFAQGLIWGIYRDDKLQDIFAVNQDQTLENVELDEIELPENALIGMVHPVELSDKQLDDWKTYLEENKISQPFEQIHRKVHLVLPTEGRNTIIEDYKGKEVSDYRFRSVMGKRGWKRGSVVDSGMVANYKKSYESLGIEVFVELDEMYIYLGEYSENIELKEVYFVKYGSVATGSYVYDSFKNDEDGRLFALKDLPTIVYSETMYDFDVLLNHIS